MKQTLRESGLGKWVDRFERVAPISEKTSLVLQLNDGRWDLYGEPDGGPRQEIDFDAEFVVTGNRLEVSHENDSNTYRWSVEGDVLRLTWLETTYPDFKGIPEEVFQRALYMTEDFVRES